MLYNKYINYFPPVVEVENAVFDLSLQKSINKNKKKNKAYVEKIHPVEHYLDILSTSDTISEPHKEELKALKKQVVRGDISPDRAEGDFDSINTKYDLNAKEIKKHLQETVKKQQEIREIKALKEAGQNLTSEQYKLLSEHEADELAKEIPKEVRKDIFDEDKEHEKLTKFEKDLKEYDDKINKELHYQVNEYFTPEELSDYEQKKKHGIPTPSLDLFFKILKAEVEAKYVRPELTPDKERKTADDKPLNLTTSELDKLFKHHLNYTDKLPDTLRQKIVSHKKGPLKYNTEKGLQFHYNLTKDKPTNEHILKNIAKAVVDQAERDYLISPREGKPLDIDEFMQFVKAKEFNKSSKNGQELLVDIIKHWIRSGKKDIGSYIKAYWNKQPNLSMLLTLLFDKYK